MPSPRSLSPSQATQPTGNGEQTPSSTKRHHDGGDGSRKRGLQWGALIVLCVVLIGTVATLFGYGPFAADGKRPPPGVGEQVNRILPAVIGTGSREYVAGQRNPDGSLVTYSPCRTWHVVVNTSGAPKGSYTQVVRAVAAVSEATGLHMVVDGTTNEPVNHLRNAYQPDRYGKVWAPILVGWTTGNANGIIGHGGSQMVVDPATGKLEYVTGVVSVDSLSKVNRDPVKLQTSLLHEMGHVVGLKHSWNVNEVMAETLGRQTEYGLGDLSGLAEMGAGPCAPGI